MSFEARIRNEYFVTVGDLFDISLFASSILPRGAGAAALYLEAQGSVVNLSDAKEILADPYLGIGGQTGPGRYELLIWPSDTWAEVQDQYRVRGRSDPALRTTTDVISDLL